MGKMGGPENCLARAEHMGDCFFFVTFVNFNTFA